MVLIFAVGRFSTKALVEVVMLKILPAVPVETLAIMLLTGIAEELRFLEASVTTREEAVKVAILMLLALVTCRARMPVEEATLNKSRPGWVEVPCTIKVAEAVVVPIRIEPLFLTENREMPVAEATLKGSKVVVPCTLKLIVEEEAFTPATVPLSKIMPVPKVVLAVQRAT